MAARGGLLVGLLLFLSIASASIVLHGPTVYLEFDEEDFSLTKLSASPLNGNLLSKPTTSLWYAQFVTRETQGEEVLYLTETNWQPDKLLNVNATTPCARRTHRKEWDSIDFYWDGVELPGTPYSVSVKLSVKLQTGPDTVAFKLSFDTNGESTNNIGLWMWELGVEQVNLTSSHYVLQNEGFGFLHHCKSGGCYDWNAVYPQSTYQFVATYGLNRHSGIYLAAHDPRAEAKQFRCNVSKSNALRELPNILSFFISAQPEGSGVGFKSFTMPYPVVLTTFNGNWWDASQIYRKWALPNANWAQAGKLRDRPDVPNWLLDLTIWVNSHWQELDILNTTGGDPLVVKERVTNIARRFDIHEGGLGFHWYEWDTLGYELGSQYTNCTSEVTCGFDTHYPEYFPPREGFVETTASLQALGVRIAPYINGRIFDMGTETWKHDHAEKWMAKHPQVSEFNPHEDLVLYEESYGSEAEFAVSCPDTPYWQDAIVDVSRRILHEHNLDGIYIDQIAAAGPRLCWDPEHGHAIGGGSSWVDGYQKMLAGVRDTAGNNTMVLTESNAEPFMAGVDIYLTLVGFSGNFTGEERIVPVFPAIYGGYYISMGAVFFLRDLSDNPNVFAAKVAQQYLFGAQMGWFSLGGRDNQVPYMGMYEALMDSKYDPEVDYLKLLSKAKRAGNNWIQEGRAMRELSLTVNGTLPRKVVVQTPYHTPDHIQDYRLPHLHKPSLAFSPVMSAVWMDSQEESLLITLTSPMQDIPAIYHWKLNTADYGFPFESVHQTFTLTEIFPHNRNVGTYKGCCIEAKGKLEGRTVVSYVLSKK